MVVTRGFSVDGFAALTLIRCFMVLFGNYPQDAGKSKLDASSQFFESRFTHGNSHLSRLSCSNVHNDFAVPSVIEILEGALETND